MEDYTVILDGWDHSCVQSKMKEEILADGDIPQLENYTLFWYMSNQTNK